MTGTPDGRSVKIAGAALIVVASLVVLRPFLVPAAWAAILAFASWPLYARIERGVRGRTGLSVLQMTVFMVLVVVVPAVLVSLALGLFLGPITMALLLTLWRDWTRAETTAGVTT